MKRIYGLLAYLVVKYVCHYTIRKGAGYIVIPRGLLMGRGLHESSE